MLQITADISIYGLWSCGLRLQNWPVLRKMFPTRNMQFLHGREPHISDVRTCLQDFQSWKKIHHNYMTHGIKLS